MIMIRDNIPTEVINDTYHKENVLESLTIKIKLENNSLCIINIYRPPKNDSFLTKNKLWNKLFNSLGKNGKHFIRGTRTHLYGETTRTLLWETT